MCIKTVLNFYSSNLFNKIQNLASPLLEHFGIEIFGYIMNSPDGSFTHVSNSPAIATSFFSDENFIKTPFYSHPVNFNDNQIFITGGWNNKLFMQSQAKLKEKYGFDNFLITCRFHEGSVYLIYFSSVNKEIALSSVFANNMSIFNCFSDYFIKEWMPYIPKMERFKTHIDDFQGNVFHKKPFKYDRENSDQQKIDFLCKIGALDTSEKQLLSKQELACAKLIANGYGYRSIGEHLNLSSRTVEHYIDSVKDKLCCYTKEELGHLLQCYQTHGLLDSLSKKRHFANH